jgi:serine phosphatase RsbU (regulator of sigma subunit)
MKSLKNIFKRERRKFIIFSGALLIILGLLNVYVVVDLKATSNDECLWITHNKDSTYLLFDKVKVGGVTWNAGIRDGDQLLAINHIMLDDALQAQRILNSYEWGEYARYTVKKPDGFVLETKVYVKKIINFSDFAYSLLSLIWLTIGFIVILAKPEGEVQRVFYRIGGAAVLWMSIVFLSGTPLFTDLRFIRFFDITSTFGLIFLPFLLVYFFWIFPRPFGFIRKTWVKRFFYTIPWLVFLAVYTHRIYLTVNIEYMGTYYRDFFSLMGRVLLIAMFTGLVSLLINYFRIKSREERKPLFSIIMAYIIGIASIIYSTEIAPAISDTIFNSPELYTPIILINIIPIAFAFSIFRYQLMDVTIVVKNTLIYGAATLFLAAIYFAVIYIIGQSISTAIGTEYQGIIAGIIFILFAILFQSTKDKMQDFLTSRFYPEQFAYQKVLLRFSSEVTTVVGMDKILDVMHSTFVEALMVKQFGIALLVGNSDKFILHKSTGISDKNLTIHKENIEHCIKEKYTLSKLPAFEQTEFTSVFPQNAYKIINENIYTIVPMIIKSKVVGLLFFGLKHSGAQFAGKDLELLQAAANQAAIAVENARLYQAEAEKFRLERDLEVARKIQEGLLPRNVPSVKGLDIYGIMKPAMQVGGDYFDLLPVSPSKIFVVVGDVSGKGLSASLYMTKLQTIIQFACTADRTPREIVIELNRKLYSLMERNWFITLTLALFDTEKKLLTFCRAGHMPVVAATNGTIKSYRTRGLGIGLEKGTIFEASLCEEEISLKANQLYAFFSDGLTEAMNENAELFGEDSLNDLLKNRSSHSSKEVIDDIWNKIYSFRGKALQSDDMTIVIVKTNDDLNDHTKQI